jgi:hypothetical protein
MQEPERRVAHSATPSARENRWPKSKSSGSSTAAPRRRPCAKLPTVSWPRSKPSSPVPALSRDSPATSRTAPPSAASPTFCGCPPKLGAVRLAVLHNLALRMNAGGAGFASVRQLAIDSGVHERTVKRHLAWARDAGFLVQTRRGHRIDDSTVIASEYRLTDPTQGDTGVTLGWGPRGQTGRPKVTDGATQGDTGVTLRGPLPEILPLARSRPRPTARVATRKPRAEGGGNRTYSSRTRELRSPPSGGTDDCRTPTSRYCSSPTPSATATPGTAT